MNNKEFIAELAQQNEMRISDAQSMMNSLLAVMGDSFQAGNAVHLSNFGAFEVKKRLERVIINPTSGQRMLVPPKLTLSFRPYSTTKDMIKKGGRE